MRLDQSGEGSSMKTKNASGLDVGQNHVVFVPRSVFINPDSNLTWNLYILSGYSINLKKRVSNFGFGYKVRCDVH